MVQENKIQGRLYICGTPIGNLEDISLRCLRILKEVHLIAAEDTRHTQKLLNYYQIKTKTTSYHQHNEREKTIYLLKQIKEGLSIALVSNAGMPVISDPGQILIEEALKQGISPIPIPGPTAFATALAISGISAHSFVFIGFLPQKKKERRETLSSLSLEEKTIIFYESPHRIQGTLQDIHHLFGPRKIVLIREITKIYEERLDGSASELLLRFQDRVPKGEMTLIMAGASPKDRWTLEDVDISLNDHLRLYLEAGMTKKEAVKRVSQERDLPRRQVYQKAVLFQVDPVTGKVQNFSKGD